MVGIYDPMAPEEIAASRTTNLSLDIHWTIILPGYLLRSIVDFQLVKSRCQQTPSWNLNLNLNSLITCHDARGLRSCSCLGLDCDIMQFRRRSDSLCQLHSYFDISKSSRLFLFEENEYHGLLIVVICDGRSNSI